MKDRSASDRDAYCIAVDIGGTRIKSGLIVINEESLGGMDSSHFEILKYYETDTVRSRNRDEILDNVIEIGRRLSRDGAGVDAIGVSCPGMIDSNLGILRQAPLLKGWNDVPISSILRSEFGLPVYIENDANAAALSEFIWGGARNSTSSVYVTVSTGLGVGIVVNGRIWKGAHGVAGEVGHLSLFDATATCEDGHKGCAEAYCTGTAISNRVSLMLGQRVSTEDAFSLAEDGNRVAELVIDDAITCLTKLIILLQYTYDPETIVVGGQVVLGQQGLIVKMLNAKMKNMIGYPPVNPNVVISRLGSQASMLGAAAICKLGLTIENP